MKLLIITVLVAYASADVSHIVGKSAESQARILSQNTDVGLEGNFQYGFDTENGISTRGQGTLKNVQAENPAQVVQGEVKWTAPTGEVVSFVYQADENGYQAQGPFIPTPPPIPEEILRALEFIRANPPKEIPIQKRK